MVRQANAVITMMDTSTRRQVILRGISQNLNYTEIAIQLGVKRGDLINDIKAMRRSGDPELRDAQRVRQAKESGDNKSVSNNRDERFLSMTGLTINEKSFQNMVEFFKPEIMAILNSRDPEAAIRKLSGSTRRAMINNGILIKRTKPDISQQARDHLSDRGNSDVTLT